MQKGNFCQPCSGHRVRDTLFGTPEIPLPLRGFSAIASLIRDDKQRQHQILRRPAPQDDRALSSRGQLQGRGISYLRQSGSKGEVPRPLRGRDRCARSERQPTHPPIASLMYCTAYNGRFTSQSSFFHGAMDVRTDIFGLYFSRKAFRLFA